MSAPEEEIYELLRERDLSVTTAESCTGGLIAAALVNVPGISEYFREGYITYSDEAKIRLLSVKKETIERYSVYSVETAAEMAEGAAKAANTDAAVSSTGIAGPEDISRELPAGLYALRHIAADRC